MTVIDLDEARRILRPVAVHALCCGTDVRHGGICRCGQVRLIGGRLNPDGAA